MAHAGRKPQPTALKLLRGNPGKRPLNALEPHPEPLAPEAPPELAGEAVAVAEWARTIAPAIARRQITAADRTWALAHCELYATWRSQTLEAASSPHVHYVGQHGIPAANMARTMAHRTLKLLLEIDSELGLTPSSRSRVKVIPEFDQTPSKWAGLLG